MPLLELLVIGGAVFALVHAVRRYRAGDPVNLALWFASLVYLFVTEPPLYFPEWFGLDRLYGFIFAHNRVHRAVHGGPAAALHRRVLPGVQPARLRARAVARASSAVAARWRVGGRRLRVPGVLRGLRPARPAAEVVGVEPGQPHRQPPGAGVGADDQHAAVRLRLVRRADLPGGAARAAAPRRGWSLALRTVVAGVLTPPAMAIAGIPSSLFDGNTTRAGLGPRRRAGPGLAGRRLDHRARTARSVRAAVRLRAGLSRCLPGRAGGVLARPRTTAGPAGSVPLRARLLRRGRSGAGRAVPERRRAPAPG